MKFGDRLRLARTNKGWSQLDLAEKSGVSQATISKIERGDQQQSVHTPILANALGVQSLWLATGDGTMTQRTASEPATTSQANTEPTGWPLGQVPLISNITAGNWCEAVDNFHPGDAEEWIPCPARHSKNAYALRVTGSSMEPKFREGEIIVVDPEIASSPYVVAKKVNSNEVTLKQLVMECGESYLKAVNPHWPEPIIKMTEEWAICGTVICKIEIF